MNDFNFFGVLKTLISISIWVHVIDIHSAVKELQTQVENLKSSK